MVKERILGVDPNEIVLHEIRRHPIGLYMTYGAAIFIATLVLVGVFLYATSQEANGTSDIMITLVAFALLVLIVLITTISASIYRSNELIITNENLIQILQQSLFDRKVSQLNLAKVQDVTVDQEGIMATLFGYGTVNIETAGEASNYHFKYVSSPNIVGKHVIEAHEQYLRNISVSAHSIVGSNL